MPQGVGRLESGAPQRRGAVPDSMTPQRSEREFHLPEIGEGVHEAEFVRWLVRPGDAVKGGQNLMEVMTDKATMEIPAPFAGTITELRAAPGQKVKVGDALLTYTPAGAAQSAPEAET